ncbi:MAG: LPS export ABC transporter permease LptG [Nitrospirae bacterium GWC2_57_9]|nr:MAG: LPS export ABC transporter permease LptG [Nitrospirae bacterium GWC2_57_9]
MRLLSRHIFGEFMRIFLTILIGILIVYLCMDFLQKADNFIKSKANIRQVLFYFLYGIPTMASFSLPIAALIAALLSLGNLSRHNEIIAMRASGVSLFGIIAPVVLGGVLISGFGFVNNEFIMPVYTARANFIKNVEIEKKQQRAVFQERKLWLRGPDNSIANIDLVTPDRNEMLGISIFKMNPDYSVRERITAKSLLWENGAWRLKQGRKYLISSDSTRSEPVDGEIFNIVDSPADLGMIAKSSGEMNFTELWDYVNRLKMSGYKAARYEVDLHNKIAFPLSSLLMVLIATPLSIQKVRSGGFGKGIAFAVLIAFAYWALMSIGTALGRSGALPPLQGAWLANVLFASASLYILYKMQKTN